MVLVCLSLAYSTMHQVLWAHYNMADGISFLLFNAEQDPIVSLYHILK